MEPKQVQEGKIQQEFNNSADRMSDTHSLTFNDFAAEFKEIRRLQLLALQMKGKIEIFCELFSGSFIFVYRKHLEV